MKKLLLLALLAFHCIGAFAQTPTLAIYSKLYTDDTQVSLNPLVAELTGRLMDNYTLVSRMEEFQALVDKELVYQASGRVDDEMLVKLGKEFGADNVCAVFVEYNKASNAYFYWVKVISTQNRDIKRNGKSTKSDLTINKQQSAANEIYEQLFPPRPKYTAADLLSYDDVYDSRNRLCYDYDVECKLNSCGNSSAIQQYRSGLKLDKVSRAFNVGGWITLVPGLACQFGWLHKKVTYEKEVVMVVDDDLGICYWDEVQVEHSTRWHDTTKAGVALTAVGATSFIIAAIISSAANKKVDSAIEIYNREIKNSKGYYSKLFFGSTPSGVGLCLKF